jgi:hypothetical protein
LGLLLTVDVLQTSSEKKKHAEHWLQSVRLRLSRWNLGAKLRGKKRHAATMEGWTDQVEKKQY